MTEPTAKKDEFEFEWKYRWGFDWFRTPWRWGIGFEMCCHHSFLVGVRIGSLLVSWGQQHVYEDMAYTN